MKKFEALRIYLQKSVGHICDYSPKVLTFRCISRRELNAEIEAKEASLNRGFRSENRWYLIYSRIAEREGGNVRLLALLSNGKENPEIEEEF